MNEGVRVLMGGLDTERLVLSGGPIGIMQAAVDLVLPYVRERKQFNAPIGTFGMMQAKVADMYTALQSSRGFAYMVAQQFDNGVKSRIDPAACLLNASTNAVKVALEAIRRSAATATSTSTRPAACCATPSSTRSARAPTRSAAC